MSGIPIRHMIDKYSATNKYIDKLLRLYSITAPNWPSEPDVIVTADSKGLKMAAIQWQSSDNLLYFALRYVEHRNVFEFVTYDSRMFPDTENAKRLVRGMPNSGRPVTRNADLPWNYLSVQAREFSRLMDMHLGAEAR